MSTSDPSGARIEAFARVLYDRPTSQTTIPLAELNSRLEAAEDEVDDLVHRFVQAGLLGFSPSTSTVRLNSVGKTTFELGCSSERVLGPPYIRSTYSEAVLHIVVMTPNGDEAGGTGFFIDRSGLLVTARHVVYGNSIIRIEDIHQNVVSQNVSVLWIGEEPLDLALLQTDTYSPERPFRYIEQIPYEPLDKLLIFGYPPYAGHGVALHVSTGEILSIPNQLTGGRQSLIISNAVAPGCSGGPVVNSGGIPVGVIAQENQLHLSGQPTGFLSATPIRYLKESALL